MSDFRISLPARQAAVNATTALIDAGGAGALKIYAGAVPAGPAAALTTQTLLATLGFSAQAFAAADGDATAAAAAITPEDAAVATGIASFFRIENGAGAVVAQGDVSDTTGAGDLRLPTTAINAGVEVSISSLTLTMPEV